MHAPPRARARTPPPRALRLLPALLPAQLKQLFQPLLNAISKPYAASVNKTLASYGLRYDDLYDPLKDEVRGRWRRSSAAVLLCRSRQGRARQGQCRTPSPFSPLQDVAEALRRLPPDVIMARNARLRRAIDLDLKHDHLHGDLLAKQTPGESYLQVRTRKGHSSTAARHANEGAERGQRAVAGAGPCTRASAQHAGTKEGRSAHRACRAHPAALQEVLQEVRAERKERASLGAGAPYTRIH